MLVDDYKHKGLRKKLVKEMVDKGISDPNVLAAMQTVPRHAFLESAFLEQAYTDKAFPIGDGQTIRQMNVFQNHSLYNANLTEGETAENDFKINIPHWKESLAKCIHLLRP